MNRSQIIGEVRIAHETYPTDEDFAYWLGSLLVTASVNQNDEFSKEESLQYFQEADILMNRILETSTDDKRRLDVKIILVQELYRVYDTKKAIEMAANLNPVGYTMQNQTMPLLKGEERIAFAKKWFPLMMGQLLTFALFARDSECDLTDQKYKTDLEEVRIRKAIYESFYAYLGDKFIDRKSSDAFYRSAILQLFYKAKEDDEALSALERFVELCGTIEKEVELYGQNATTITSLLMAISQDEKLRMKIVNGELKTVGAFYTYQIRKEEKRAKQFAGNLRFETAMERLEKITQLI